MLDPDSSIPLVILVSLLILYAVVAAAREAITSLKRSKRIQLVEEGKPSAQLIDELAENTTLLLATEQLILKPLGYFMAVYAAFVYAAPLAQAISVNNFFAAVIILLLLAFVVLLFGELIPREFAKNNPEALVLWAVYPFCWLSYLTSPLARFTGRVGRSLAGRSDEEEYSPGTITEEDLLSYVDAGEEEGIFKEDEKEMIYSIFDLDDTFAREVMVPRIDMIAVAADASIEEAVGLSIQAGHSRLPVYDDTIDNIIGILYVKDLLVYWLDQNTQPASVKDLVREVYYVPETKPVSDLLKELQAKKVHIAIVVDEYGGTAGLATIEDIIEEIVGEIQDEHDADEFYMQFISDDEYIFSARMDLDDINDMMSINLPTDESDTLGGLIYNMFGRIPKTGDSLSGESFGAPELHFTVLSVDGRRIKTVKIKRVPERGHPSENAEPVTDKGRSPLMRNIRNTVSESS